MKVNGKMVRISAYHFCKFFLRARWLTLRYIVTSLFYQVNYVSPFIGIHVVVLNQATGARMASSWFETFSDPKYSDALVQFLNDVTPGRIVLFATRVSTAMCLQKCFR